MGVRHGHSRGFRSYAVIITVGVLVVAAFAEASIRQAGRPHIDAQTILRGTVADLQSGARIRAAHVLARGIGRGTTNNHGVFKLRRSPPVAAGTYPFIIRASGYWPRRAYVQIPPAGGRVRTDHNLFPRPGPALKFFDRAIRDSLNGLTTRWVAPPMFVVADWRLACVVGTPLACETWVATSEPITAQIRAWYEEIVLQDAPILTGGFVSGSLETWSLQPGTMLSQQELLENGRYLLAEHTDLQLPFSGPRAQGGNPIVTQALIISRGDFTRWLVLRLFAQGLGYRGLATAEDCADWLRLSLRTSACESHADRATRNDRIYGAALYARPAGNRWPDEDP